MKRLMESKKIPKEELGEFLRKRGLHSQHLTLWDQEFAEMVKDNGKKQEKKVRDLQKKVRELEKELNRKDKALAETAALLVLKKVKCAYGGQRGRLILRAHKGQVVNLIEEAHESGAKYAKACEVVEISLRTLQRWKEMAWKIKEKDHIKKLSGK